VAREQGDYAEARAWLERSLALSEDLRDESLRAKTLDGLGTVAHALGDYDLARLRYDQGLALAGRVGNRYEQAWLLHNLGCLVLDQGDYPAARAWLAQSLELRDNSDNVGLVDMLAEFAALAAAEGLAAGALRLAGATASLTQRTGIPVQHSERGRYEHWLEIARRSVSMSAAAAACEEGRQMPPDQVIAHALAPREPLAGAPRSSTEPPRAQAADRLTLRQREVAALIGQGRSNREIGQALVITERTVAAHIEHILDRLGVTSRTQIAVWAAEHGLLALRTA
jgi:DNA-binding CsgD family transcriptional regulator